MKIKIKKETTVMAVTIGIACFTLMLVMFMQFKVVRQTDITAIEDMRESDLRVELAEWNQKYEELNSQYEEVMAKITEYQTEKESDEQTAQLLETELEQLNKSLGKTDVEGEGIMIVLVDKAGTQLTDGETVKSITIEDLLIIVNDLFAAGAEAISINDQRIVAMSDIFNIGSGEESFIKVNGERIISPYVIKAIGNQNYLESAVIGKGGRVDVLEGLGHEVTIEKSNKKIEIEKYSGTIGTKYLN